METIRLQATAQSFMEFKGRMLFQYNADPETRYTLYETAEGELGEYVLYVESADKNVAYCLGESSNSMQWLTPQIDSIPDDCR